MLFGKTFKTEITSINLKWHGVIHKAKGLKTNKRIFDVSIPFHNRIVQEDSVRHLLKSSDIENILLERIDVGAPFKLVGIEPQPPLTIKYGESVDFKLAIEAPQYSYKGPIEIAFTDREPERVKIEINKVVLIGKGRRVEMPHSGMIMELMKSQVFKIDIQLYNLLGYLDIVKGIEASAPFDFVSSMPEPPFKIDDKSSFIVTVFIKAPEISYGGELELTFKT
ncbi:MAG: hypothetical protein ACP5SA_00785 [Candidatus Micrarchaeia archaeon]